MGDPTARTERLVSEAARDDAVLDALLHDVGPATVPHPVRESAAAALKSLAVEQPQVLFRRWTELLALLDCDNAFSRMAMVHVIASLAPADTEGRIGESLDAFLDHMGDMVGVAGHVLAVTPQIVAAQPQLRDRVTARILSLGDVAIPDRLELLRSYAIEALDAYLTEDQRTPEVVGFVEAGLHGNSPKTRKLAAATLRRWGVALP